MNRLRLAVVVTALATFLVTTPAAASAPAGFGPAKEVALPPGSSGLPGGYLPTLACPAVGDCVAAGAYGDAHKDTEGLIATESHGRWLAPTTLVAPPGAAANPGTTVDGLSCPGVGSCALVGGYYDSGGDEWPFVADEVHGVWQRATELALPSDALASGQTSLVRSVACAAVGTCVAVGTYLDDTTPVSRNVAFVADEIGGVWRATTEVALPGALNANPYATLNQVACPSAGACVAVGSFLDADNVTEGLVVRQSGATWSASTLPPPIDASAYAGTSIGEITCIRHATCTVFGTYNAAGRGVQAFADTGSGAYWSPAHEIELPAGAAANPHAFLYGFQGVACASPGNCALGGQYRDAAGDFEGFLADEVNGTWHPAVEAALPADGASAGQNGGIVSLACPRAGECRAGAAYLDQDGRYQGLLLSESDGVWQRGTKVALPHGATSVGVDGGVYAVACPSLDACTAVGSYQQNASTYEGFTIAN